MSYDIENKAIQLTSATVDECLLQPILREIEEAKRDVEFYQRKLDEANDALMLAREKESGMREYIASDEFAEFVRDLKRLEEAD